MTRIQHKEFANDSREDIVINHVHPGYVNTQMSEYKGVLTPERGIFHIVSCYQLLLVLLIMFGFQVLLLLPGLLCCLQM